VKQSGLDWVRGGANADLAPWEAGAAAFADMMGYEDDFPPDEASTAFGFVTAVGWLMGEQNAWGPELGTPTTSRMGPRENALKTVLGAAMLAGPLKGGGGGGVRGAIEGASEAFELPALSQSTRSAIIEGANQEVARGGVTAVGRALQKHSARAWSVFSSAMTNAERARIGRDSSWSS
jgi:hypothetical protein